MVPPEAVTSATTSWRKLQIGALTMSPEKAVPFTVTGWIEDTHAVAVSVDVAALKLPSFLSVRLPCATPVGLTLRLNREEQALLLPMVIVAVGGAPLALVDMHSTPALAVLPSSRVPVVTVALLLVAALNVAKVPPAVAAVMAPRISIPTSSLLTLFTSTASS